MTLGFFAPQFVPGTAPPSTQSDAKKQQTEALQLRIPEMLVPIGCFCPGKKP